MMSTILFLLILNDKEGLLEIQFQQLGPFAANAQALLYFFLYNLFVIMSQIRAVEYQNPCDFFVGRL